MALHAPLEMDRIDAVPRRRGRNYRDFSRLADRNEPFIDFADKNARVGQREFAAWKKQPSEKLKSPFAKSFDTARGHLRDDRLRAPFREPIEAALDPIEHLIGRNSIQHIVANVGYEGGGRKRLAILQIQPKRAGKNSRKFSSEEPGI
jgi:hypothetical protein